MQFQNNCMISAYGFCIVAGNCHTIVILKTDVSADDSHVNSHQVVMTISYFDMCRMNFMYASGVR